MYRLHLPWHYWGTAVLFLCLFGNVWSVNGQGRNDSVLSKVDSLQPVVVRPRETRPRLRGDTIEYNTGNISLKRYANVEQLIGRLPGLQIDVNGNITYNGERIERLLVDGEDIFGGDPTLITKNLDASKIDKVQLLNRRGDRARITGIDDGSRMKVMNLILKDDARNSSSGKAEGGGNLNGNYEAKGFGVAFRRKEQVAGIGFAGNTGTTGYSAGSGSGSIAFLNENRDALGGSAGMGIPSFIANAIHYSNTWNASENHLSGNYQFSHYSTNPISSLQTLQFQRDSVFKQYQKAQSNNQQDQHWVYGEYEFNPSQKSDFLFSFYGSNSNGQNRLANSGNSSFNDILVNTSQRTIVDKVSHTSLGGNLSWRTQIGKNSDRTISLTSGFTKGNNRTNGFLYSINQFYKPDVVVSRDTIDQRKDISANSLSLTGGISNTEPLWKGAQLGLDYELSYVEDNPFQETFDKANGKYMQKVDSLSSNISARGTTQTSTLTLEGKGQHFSYIVASELISYAYRQMDAQSGINTHLNYTTLTPQAKADYIVDQRMGFSISYNTAARIPSMTQLAATRNNNDPLHLNIGNPNLIPSFSQTFVMEIHRLKNWMSNIMLHYSTANNDISTRNLTDSFGRQVSQPVNVRGGRSAGVNLSTNKKLFGIDMGFSAVGTYSRSTSYINADLNNSDNYSIGSGISLNQYVQNQYAFQVNGNIGYIETIASINRANPIHYWTQNYSGSFTLFMFHGYEVNTNGSYLWQQGASDLSANTSVILLNAYISRSFVQDKLSLRILVNNALNQNAGINRKIDGNSATQSYTNILGRYYMFSAIYHFDKKLKKGKL